mgnify:FL=1|tara:strand:- start:185 stop:952 length:768 start_codon:yes stop_codon:yes gene_type:complete
MVSLQELPKKVQYITIDSNFVTGTNNTFSFNLNLSSNTHVSDISKVCGLKIVDFYITQVGTSSGGTGNGAKYVDIVCENIPKVAQILNERHGQLFARIPLERAFDGSNNLKIHDKQWKSFNRQTCLFNPISIQKLDFVLYEQQGDGDYVKLQPDSEWFMTLEVTTIDVKEKPINKEVQILEALHKLIGKIEDLNVNVKKLPDKKDIEKMEKEKKKKYPLYYLFTVILLIGGGFYILKRKNVSTPVQVQMPIPQRF